MSSIVKLNVGGTVFVTSKSTLTKFEGFFRTLLETNVGLEKDDAGCIFIDPSPKHFDLILNFMRDGDVEITKDHKQVMAEAQYYLLGELIDLCKTSMQPGHLLPNTLPLIESDKQYLHILANQTKPIIIIHYNISEWHSMPPMFNPFEFLEKYSDKYDIYFNKLKRKPKLNPKLTPKPKPKPEPEPKPKPRLKTKLRLGLSLSLNPNPK